MKNSDLTTLFASRLRETMIAAGFSSQRSPSGVSIHKLVEITEYSAQICRKYLRGETMPDLSKLVKIATELKVSPGWLMFGEVQNVSRDISDKVIISKSLLHYIFINTPVLYSRKMLQQKVPDFLVELIHDISLMNITEEQAKKIIDMALASAKHY